MFLAVDKDASKDEKTLIGSDHKRTDYYSDTKKLYSQMFETRVPGVEKPLLESKSSKFIVLFGMLLNFRLDNTLYVYRIVCTHDLW